MYHYLFTNDFRISALEKSLIEAGQCFLTNTVPSAEENKSANNNMLTLGFYFNLFDGSNCAKVAASGNVRKVVLNFIKKFQFPNLRTSSSYDEARKDGISLAPMRVIVKLLYMISMSEGSTGYLKRDEIREFIFYNERVAKRKDPDINGLYQSIILFRKEGILPNTIDIDHTHRNWKHEDRQIREMVNVLLWSGCVVEDEEGKLKIHHESLTRSDEADIFEIVNEKGFWEGGDLDSYRKYMDIDDTDFIHEERRDFEREENIYKKAAQRIVEYVETEGYELDASEETLIDLYDAFNTKFGPQSLKEIPDDKLLKELFYTSDSTNDSLCYWLEFHNLNKKYFGSISGGSSYRFGIFQRKKDKIWVTGSPTKPEEVSDEEAMNIGREIRDMLLLGVEVINNAGDIKTLEDYEILDDELNRAIGKYASFAWVHKYFSMVFPSKFATWHTSDWHKHILFAYGIKPSEKYYGRSGQLAIIANYAKMVMPKFTFASYDKFGDIKQFYRISTSDKSKNYFSEWKKDNIAAIGWNNIDSLENYIVGDDVNIRLITDKLIETYYPFDNSMASRKSGELASFYRTDRNSIFVATDGEKLLALGDNIGKYHFDDTKPFAHYKPTIWHMRFSGNENLPTETEGLKTSCHIIANPENLLYLYYKYYCEPDMNEVVDKMSEKEIMKREARKDPIHPLNLILYGAPGTGKTFCSIEYAVAIVENRPVNLGHKSQEDRKFLMEEYESYVQDGQILFTTFHQSYGYEEFIQGIRPDTKAGGVFFTTRDGIFKKIADNALRDKEKKYVIIIDEINRGNISRIFGELITLIEEDKRYGELNQLSITLPLGDKFTVPNNLYIIGTMNSADKSISLIDTALRRRFDFVEMVPDEYLIEDNVLRNTFNSLNGYLKKEFRNTDLLIGHSYFIGKSLEDLGDIMNKNIIPLLYEYFFDDEAKVRKALECLNGTEFIIDNECKGRVTTKKKV